MTTAIAPAYELALPPTDALPYYDTEIDKPGMRAKVEREIAREMKEGVNGVVPEDRLPPNIELFQDHPELAELLQKASEGVALNVLDRNRYQLSAPAQGDESTPEEWKAALHNAEAQLMHSETRLTNLELLKKYGGESDIREVIISSC
jgi:pre-mRNA-splicing factor SPF27